MTADFNKLRALLQSPIVGLLIIEQGIIIVYVRKLFKLKNDGKKEYLCLLSICTANLNGINTTTGHSGISCENI